MQISISNLNSLHSYFVNTFSHFIENTGKLISQIEDQFEQLSNLKKEVSNGKTLVIYSNNDFVFHKAQHLYEELLGKYFLPRPSIPSILDASSHIKFNSSHMFPIFFEETHDEFYLKLGNKVIIKLFGTIKDYESLSAQYSILLHLICELFEPDYERTYNHFNDYINTSVKNAQATIDSSEFKDQILTIERSLLGHLSGANKTIVIGGNGGSACDALEFLSSISRAENKCVNALSLLDPSYISCVGNDYGFSSIFDHPLHSLEGKHYLYFGISTSGKSSNVIKALETCLIKNIDSYFFGSGSGGKCGELANFKLCVLADVTSRIQELHSLALLSIASWLNHRSEIY
jgi:D-sedoheptulose 7-phosphate isomerase